MRALHDSIEMRAFLVVVGLAGAAAGCVLDDLDYEGRPCPCADGWHCDERGGPPGVCVRDAADAATADAPGSDVSVRDGGPDGGGCPAGELFCDGFEDGDRFVTQGPWELTAGPPTRGELAATMDETQAGAWSLRARTLVDGGQAAVLSQQLGGLTEGELWARAWLYVPSGQDIQAVIPLSVGNALTGWVHLLLGPDGTPVLVVGAQPDPIDSYPAPTTYPLDAWFCARLQVTIGEAESAVLHLGDTPAVSSASGIDTLPAGGYTSIIAGIGFSLPAQPPMELYVDDVVVDTREVGCD